MQKVKTTTLFVAFDIETTGLKDSDKIIEFGAVKVDNGEVKEKLQTLVNPETYTPIEVLMLTGINKDDLTRAPNIQQVRKSIIDFIADLPLVAHNAPFDISFVEREIEPIRNKVYDTLQLSRILLPFIQNHKLGTLFSSFFDETPNFHRALEDAMATARIFLKLKEIAETLSLDTLKKILSIGQNMREDTLDIFSDALNRTITDSKKAENQKPVTNLFSVPDNTVVFNATQVQQDYPPTEEEVQRILTDKTILNKFVSDYEKRPEQVELSKKVMKSFLNDEILLSEAGTGTGKTFAYLIPSILWSDSTKERVIISTYTKNLQEQLFYKDIKNISNGVKIRFEATLLKGRNNYLCMKRWNNLLTEGIPFLDSEEKQYLLSLVVWQEITNTGDISENTSFWISSDSSLWSKLSCDTKECEMNKCPFFQECYLANVRKKAQESNIVIINHSLLFSDINADQKILGDYSRVIIDEAHNLEKAATNFLGISISSWKINNILNALDKQGQGILARIQKSLAFLTSKEETIKASEMDKTIKLVNSSRKIFSEITKKMLQQLEYSEYTGKLRLKKSDTIILELTSISEEFYENLKQISLVLKHFYDLFEGDAKPPIFSELPKKALQINRELEETVEDFHNIVSCNDKNSCYWIQSIGQYENLKFVSAPIVVAPLLREKLFNNLLSAVLVSATALIENRFSYLEQKVGIADDDRLVEFSAGSSFNFNEQVLTLLPSFLTEPQRKGFFMDVTDILRKVILSTRKGSLILFTSYRLLNKVYEQLVETLLTNDIPLLAQGKTGSKGVITKQFNEIQNSVLLGTYSFWEGFDVPGKSLEILIITKLPFPSPKEPITEARAEYAESENLSSFDSLFVPEAIVKLRQGFGRLIRRKTDRGIVLILDTRLIKRNYGRRFLDSLPAVANMCYTEEELLRNIRGFLI